MSSHVDGRTSSSTGLEPVRGHPCGRREMPRSDSPTAPAPAPAAPPSDVEWRWFYTEASCGRGSCGGTGQRCPVGDPTRAPPSAAADLSLKRSCTVRPTRSDVMMEYYLVVAVNHHHHHHYHHHHHHHHHHPYILILLINRWMDGWIE